jgi:SAM-dependent methyltransferase
MHGIRELAEERTIACPLDGGTLAVDGHVLVCTNCAAEYPLHGDRLADLTPPNRVVLPGSSGDYAAHYLAAAAEPYREGLEHAPWADPGSLNERARNRTLRHVDWSLRVLARSPSPPSVICDISAGPGNHTFAYARRYPLVLHCDISADALSYALARAERERVDNIVFLRVDYLFSPFPASLDAIVCFDTLIRGPLHEQALLAELLRSVRPGGLALVDFHNWWHNPVRRMGLLRDTFAGNTSYRRREVEALLRHAGARYELVPFHYEPTGTHRIVPPTRHGALLKL